MTILFISGSTRKGSFNTKLVKYSYDYAIDIGIESKLIDLADYEMPIYQGDWENENGLPQDIKKLKEIFFNSKGFFISTTEYNGFFSPLLMNTIDWLSRPETKDETSLKAFRNKVAMIVAASPGKLGGIRALPHLRLFLNNVGVNVLPSEMGISFAMKNFDDDGNLLDEGLKEMLYNHINRFKDFVAKGYIL
jgi:NAD(P)H-dependent FMN reductase